jgi:hypothetical protein
LRQHEHCGPSIHDARDRFPTNLIWLEQSTIHQSQVIAVGKFNANSDSSHAVCSLGSHDKPPVNVGQMTGQLYQKLRVEGRSQRLACPSLTPQPAAGPSRRRLSAHIPSRRGRRGHPGAGGSSRPTGLARVEKNSTGVILRAVETRTDM